jgi:EmrB/QacA subfamily drug resistance transporter
MKIAEPPPTDFFVRQSWYPWLIVGLTCISAFIGQLDASIVQLALPTLSDVFDARLEAVSWVALAYLLAFASFLPIFGRLSEIHGRKLLYLAGYLVFTVATALCGFASNLTELVAFRALQGIGGAMLGANSISILVKAVDPGRRARAMGFFAAAQAIGVSAGPAVGGLLLGAFGWRWLFWVAVPFGFAAAVAGWFALPQTIGRARNKAFDWRGALFLTPALAALVLMLNQASVWGPAALIACGGAGVVLIALFIRQERACESPLIDLQLFREPAFSCGVVAVMLSYALLYGMFLLISFALVRGYHDTAAQAGARLAMIPIALGVTAPFSGALSDRLGPRLLSVAGMTTCIAALIILSILAREPRIGFDVGMALLAFFGVGLGLFIAPNNTATMNAAPASLSGEAGGLLNLMRVFGTCLGVAGAASMLSWRLQVLTGLHDRGMLLAEQPLLGAVESCFWMLAVFAAIAGAASLVRHKA